MLNFEEYIAQLPDNLQELINKGKTIEERLDYHPEKYVYKHIEKTYYRALTTNDKNLICAAVFHDIGKSVTYIKHGNSYGHDGISAKIVEDVKDLIINMECDYDCVYNIVKEHMRINQLDKMKKTKADLLLNNKYFDYIVRFKDIDNMLLEKDIW